MASFWPGAEALSTQLVRAPELCGRALRVEAAKQSPRQAEVVHRAKFSTGRALSPLHPPLGLRDARNREPRTGGAKNPGTEF